MCEIPGKADELEYQIWINDKSLKLDHGGMGGFRLERTGRLPSGTKSVGFADMGMFVDVISSTSSLRLKASLPCGPALYHQTEMVQ